MIPVYTFESADKRLVIEAAALPSASVDLLTAIFDQYGREVAGLAPDKKLRSDSKWHLLKPAQQEEARTMYGRGATLNELAEFFLTATGQPWTIRGLSVHFKGETEREEKVLTSIRARNRLVDACIAEAKQSGRTLSQTALQQGAATLANVIDANIELNDEKRAQMQFTAIDKAIGIRSTELEEKKITLKTSEQKLAREKFQFDAAKRALAILPTLRTIATNKSLTASAKIYAVRRQLFGVLPEDSALIPQPSTSPEIA